MKQQSRTRNQNVNIKIVVALRAGMMFYTNVKVKAESAKPKLKI
jgi:hypothetical protein